MTPSRREITAPARFRERRVLVVLNPDVSRYIRDDMVPAVEAGKGRYSEPFLAAIDAGLTVRPEDRPQSMAQFAECLAWKLLKIQEVKKLLNYTPKTMYCLASCQDNGE